MQAYRAALLRFDPDADPGHPQAIYDADGLLVLDAGDTSGSLPRRVVAAGPYHALRPRFPALEVEHLPGRVLAPGFVDLHVHYPQTDVIGSPAEGLLPWLEHYTFPHEARFSDPVYAGEVADFFFSELDRHGVTTALTFATSHPGSVDALMSRALARGQRLIAGKVLQDRHSPDGVRDQTEQGLQDTEALIGRWHGRGRLGYAITPRFVPSCSDAQLRGAGELAARHPQVWVQSHAAENLDEVRWVHQLHPNARSYLEVYGDLGLLRERAIYAHCIHIDDADRQLLRSTGAAVAVCPTSNLFLGSGFFDFASAERAGVRHGLASDVGGGTSFSPFHTMHAAYTVARQSVGRPGISLAPEHLWWQHTAGAAAALDLGDQVGNLLPGCEADFVVLNPKATPLLARRTAQTETMAEWLFAMIVLGDERLIAHTVIQGQTLPTGMSDNRA